MQTLKNILFGQKEIKEAGMTKMNIWKVELKSNEVNNLSTENIKNHEKSKKMEPMSNLVPASTATTLAAVLSSQQPILPFRRDFNHKFYNREKAINEIARIANMNYSNRLSSYHQKQYFILVPGRSGIGKSRIGIGPTEYILSHALDDLVKLARNGVDDYNEVGVDNTYLYILFIFLIIYTNLLNTGVATSDQPCKKSQY